MPTLMRRLRHVLLRGGPGEIYIGKYNNTITLGIAFLNVKQPSYTL